MVVKDIVEKISSQQMKENLMQHMKPDVNVRKTRNGVVIKTEVKRRESCVKVSS